MAILPWGPLALAPILFGYAHLTNSQDPAFGQSWQQGIIDALDIPNDAHGGSVPTCLLHLLLPYGIAIALYLTAKGPYAMDQCVKVEGVLKASLQLHAVAFLAYSVGFEVAPFVFSKVVGADYLPSTATIFVLKTALSDLFMVGAFLFAIMSLQKQLPRWCTWVPLVQASYNVMNDYRWSQDASVPGGSAVPYRLRYLDTSIFLTLFVSYVYAHFTAILPGPIKKRQ
jgi:hypothetical protein